LEIFILMGRSQEIQHSTSGSGQSKPSAIKKSPAMGNPAACSSETAKNSDWSARIGAMMDIITPAKFGNRGSKAKGFPVKRGGLVLFRV